MSVLGTSRDEEKLRKPMWFGRRDEYLDHQRVETIRKKNIVKVKPALALLRARPIVSSPCPEIIFYTCAAP